MDHNIVLKPIGSIVVILIHSEFSCEDIFIFLWLFWSFSCLKTLFLDFHQEKLSCNADMPYFIQLRLMTKPTKFWYKKSWDGKTYIFHVQWSKMIKHLAKKSFSVFNGVWTRSIEHTKTFFAKCIFFIIVYQRTWRMRFL